MSYSAVRRWLTEHTPLEPSLLDGAGVDMLVGGRIAACGAADEAGYVALLDRSGDEVSELIAGIAVPETWLFRYPRSFELLAEFASRRLAEGQASLHLCSIGCATGQEAYCMAMAALHAGWAPERVRVDAIDRNREFLRVAAVGDYGPGSIRTEIPGWAWRYLERADDRIRIDASVASIVRFAQGDAAWPGALAGVAPCDAVFCRNLLIYLNPAARARVLDSICAALAIGGLLFVGHAEQAIRGAAPLRPVALPHVFALERMDIALGNGASVPRVTPLTATIRPAPRDQRRSSPIGAPKAAPKLVSAPPEETIDDAAALADEGRVADAERVVRGIIARGRPSGRAFELLGMIRLVANDVPGARRLFEQAVYLEPNRPVSLLQLAIISERSGDSQRTSVLWERARRASESAEAERRP